MHILTFDIEDWFHILDHDDTKSAHSWSNYEKRLEMNMDKIFHLLDTHNVKGTFFCLGWVAKEYPNVIKKIHQLGYEVATHSDVHRLAYEQSPSEFTQDLQTSIHRLEDLTGTKVISYRAPGFSLKKENKWVFEILVENGIEMDCSIFPAKRSHGGFKTFGEAKPSLINVNGAILKEFPISVASFLGSKFVFSGGGYFRLIPFSLIDFLSKIGEYQMTYFHPRDIDPDQPVLPNLTPIRQFKSYYGLSNCYNKLDKLLSKYPFIDLIEANQLIDWGNANVIDYSIL